MNSNYIMWFSEISRSNTADVGGKGANLGELYNANFLVPDGFVVTSRVFDDFVKSNGLLGLIKNELRQYRCEDIEELNSKSAILQNRFLECKLPESIIKNILSERKRLSSTVSVRSSSTSEDSMVTSCAGQFSSYLNVHEDADLLANIIKCYASLFNPNAILYMLRNKVDFAKVKMAVVIQNMVMAEKSGVMFSADPIFNRLNVMILESVTGLGECLVSGSTTPDTYFIDKKSEVVIDKNIAEFEILNSKELSKLIKMGMVIESHFRFPQDIEWSMANDIFILQSRPITTIKWEGGQYV